jgi:RNA polymerase sigma factor (sigma-70 family)
LANPTGAVPAADSEFVELVERIRRHDVAAETCLYDRFGPRVQYLAWRDLRSAGYGDDVRSETMLRVLQAVREGRLRSPEALPAFVLQTARNVIHEVLRQDRRFVPLPDGGSEPQAPSADPEDPGAVRALAIAIKRLGARDRAFLRMHYYDDLSRLEIARRLGVHEDRVRLIKSRALQRFRDAYAQVTAR